MLLKERVPCCFVTEKSFLTISATDIVVPVCSKMPLLYLLTQKVAQKFGYVLGIGDAFSFLMVVRRFHDLRPFHQRLLKVGPLWGPEVTCET